MLAIVIPYYKISFFEDTLASLTRQTCKKFKVYIGDDASPENPVHLIKKYETSLNLTYKRFSQNIGRTALTKQWERCINLTNDEQWLMILGDDDLISENYVEEFYKNLNAIIDNNIQVVRFASQLINMLGHVITEKFENPLIENAANSFYRKHFVTGRSSLSEYIFSKKSYLKFGFRNIPLAWGADNLAWLEFSECKDIYSINKATCYVRISDLNISRPGFQEDLKLGSKLICFRYVISNFLQNFDKEHRIHLIKYFENLIYRSNRYYLKDWLLLSFYLLKKFRFLEFLKFQRRYLIRTLIRND